MPNLLYKLTLLTEGLNSGPYYNVTYTTASVFYPVLSGTPAYLPNVGDSVVVAIPSGSFSYLAFNLNNGIGGGCELCDNDVVFVVPTSTTTSTTTTTTTVPPTTSTTTTTTTSPTTSTTTTTTTAPPTTTTTTTSTTTTTTTGASVEYQIDNAASGDSATACAGSTTTSIVWAAPGNTTPIVGMFLYNESSLTTTFVGSVGWRKLTGPLGTYAIEIDASGEITNKVDC
jgi:hypothetical protein